MKNKATLSAAMLLVAFALTGCGGPLEGEPLEGSFPEGAYTASEPPESAEPSGLATSTDALVGPVAGSIPSGMPPRLMVGLAENSGLTWMKSSGVPWNARYRYFVKGWVNNFGWGTNDGAWGLAYLRECAASGYLPAVAYYQMQGEPGGGEGSFLAKAQNASTMRGYFRDFKVLMGRVKEFGQPALILVEADGFALLEQQARENPNAYAAVAATGMPELAGLPNTVAGWGMAFLQLRKAAGANNAILGIHISAWASGKDLAYFNVTDSLQPEVNKVANFLKPLGLAANQTGASWDVLVGDPLDRDSDYFRVTSGSNRWWDASDGASVNSKSFNRYAEWMRLWNVAVNKRWVLWQIPLGNSNHLNVYNNGGSRQGYKDNRPEYFFGSGSRTHLEKFATSGAIALLFGQGASGQSSFQNDTYTDGQLFMKSRAGAFLRAGGLAIPAGPGTGGTTTPPPPPPPPPPTDGGTSTTDPARYGFESGTQGWTRSGAIISAVSSTTAKPYAGTRSLAVSFAGSSSGLADVYVGAPTTPPGALVTFRIWIPAGSAISSVQPYVLQGSGGGWRWTGNWKAVSSLSVGAWNTLTVQVPGTAVTPLSQLGVELATNGGWTGTAYVDSVTW